MTQTTSIHELRWVEALDEVGPLYLQIVRFMERALGDGRLRPGDRLPPQRDMAKQLGIDLTTVTRAYAEARSRHLIHAKGAAGSFVSAPRFDTVQVLDLGMNSPPPPAGIDMRQLLQRTCEQILTHADTAALMSYHPGGGTPADRRAGAAWLEPALGAVPMDRMIISPGAQVALAALILALTQPGEAIATEPLIYPGMIAAAQQLGRTLIAVPADDEGMLPDALEELVARTGLRLVYLNPTLRNPVATTMGTQRRDAIAEVAAKLDLTIIEDDPYWPLADAPPSPLAVRAPERTYYLATLSKALSPGLRTAYLIAPDADARSRLLASLRSIALMSTPLLTDVATQWIHDGTATRLLDGVREEARERQVIAARELGREALPTVGGIHLWLPLPPRWTAQSLTLAARQEGLAVTPSSAFTPHQGSPEALRVSLGGTPGRAQLTEALARLARLLRAASGNDAAVV